MHMEMSLRGLKRKTGHGQRTNECLRQRFLLEEATILQNRTPLCTARLGSAQLGIFVVPFINSGMKRGRSVGRRREGGGLQVIVADPLESVVAVEIIAADVVCGVGGADPSERHRAQLG